MTSFTKEETSKFFRWTKSVACIYSDDLSTPFPKFLCNFSHRRVCFSLWAHLILDCLRPITIVPIAKHNNFNITVKSFRPVALTSYDLKPKEHTVLSCLTSSVNVLNHLFQFYLLLPLFACCSREGGCGHQSISSGQHLIQTSRSRPNDHRRCICGCFFRL